MKKVISALCVFALIFCLCSCGKGDLGKQTTTNAAGVVEYQTVGTFDYGDYAKEKDAEAIKTGFVNKQQSECMSKKDAKALAQKELKEDEYGFSEIKIDFDVTEGMWRVSYSFTSEQTLLKQISVCINEQGLTQLIVKEKAQASASTSAVN